VADIDAARQLTGQQKAAVLMLALNEQQSVALFTKMDEEEIMEISQAMANLGKMDSDIVEAVFREFIIRLSSTGSLIGTYEGTERILRQVMGDGADNFMEELRGPAGRTTWEKLGNVNEEMLAAYLKNENPQTVAVVLSKLDHDHAARVLSVLPEESAMEVINRMLSMEGVRKEILQTVENTLRTEFMSNLARTSRRDPHESMADIFNNFDRATEKKFLENLEESNSDSADRIKSLMFTFEDLNKLDPGSIQVLLRSVEKDKLGIALKGASEDLRDLFFSNMSDRAGKILREDMEALGPVRLRDVDEAQGDMVTVAKDLSDRGEIMIADGGGGDELVY
tara:strand:+ start:267 stop:1280 length:1014 start_codon:yes stop_codon:yes gene_type:complete